MTLRVFGKAVVQLRKILAALLVNNGTPLSKCTN
ncbi:hypothetical protein SNOG_05450 [Parastagonospora nodorum SN15]|uniref:Uncharacterized protein n=1 Tax=Phaeosphaeria nodorum (strain SN15 / ATCC MYA-4574 / FGSC 10173) TaxID=321614 RepID=Q0US14_PHANO|nr:hypothetical protein SNOG_05450 [Parastagonospora nodorum SN15]EAT87841.1 hypothetical protein SNOG_05450 [Parastagonospora nodorum SN15]